MTAQEYSSTLLPMIKRQYSHADGLLVECLSNASKKKHKLLFCVGSGTNPPAPWDPERCMIWFEDDLLYDGPLNNAKEIARLMRLHHSCYFTYTSVRKLEGRGQGQSFCIKDNCRNQSCGKKCPFVLQAAMAAV